ncbi:MAG: RIP metalloprotease RseP [Alphaproteobacteria bacterium]|nr:RIP metalloprotease RseP [Alphaproteobacteria bacterium]
MEIPTTILGWAYAIGVGGLGFLFVITLVVFVHELGHFLAARYFGVRVESFSIGFGRAVAGFKDSYGTHWKIGWLPLGGYVKFWGDESVSSTPDHEKLERASEAERAGSFHHKPLYQKAIIAVGGPVANFILALFILSGMYLIYGDYVVSPQIGRLLKGAPAEAAGFQIGDTLLSIDGAKIYEFDDIVSSVSVAQGRELDVLVRRGTEEMSLKVTPQPIEKRDPFGAKVMDAGIGIGPVTPGDIKEISPGSPAEAAGLKAGDVVYEVDGRPLESFADVAKAIADSAGRTIHLTVSREVANSKKPGERETLKFEITPKAVASTAAGMDQTISDSTGIVPRIPGAPKSVISVTFGPIDAVERAASRIRFIVVKTLNFIGQLLTGTGDYQQLSGPIGIAKVSGQVLLVFGVVALINLAAVLSVSIGLLNLFPIPMLDGGHLLYYGIEAVRGRPLGERAQELGFQIGFMLVVSLMLFATWNDVTKFLMF